MARCLIIGCGCRGLSLAGTLRRDGHAIRGTTRRSARLREIADAGAEPWLGDPDRVSTLVPALDHVTVACILLGSASGPDESLAALHGTRLEMLLTKLLDTTIRGLVYEATGSVSSTVLAGGLERVRAACEGSRIPYRALCADPSDCDEWLRASSSAVGAVLGAS